MNDSITVEPGAETVLCSLQPLFAPHGNVTAVQLINPAVVEEFRPGGAKDPDLADVPKPGQSWVFGVELGAAHDGARLCALVFTNWSCLEAFYKTNPALHGTLVTCWHGAAAIWLRVTGQVAREFTAEGVHWCSSGAIPVGCPKQAPQVFVSQPGEIRLLGFDQLIWTEQQQSVIAQVLLEMEVGPPFRTGTRGRRLINAGYWARFFADAMQISYDPDQDRFAWADPVAGTPIWRNEEDSLRIIAQLFQTAAKSFGGEFPEGEVRLARVRQILGRIKLHRTLPRTSDDEVLDDFLKSQVVCAPGKSITSQEFVAAFARYCGNINRVAAPTSWFHRKLGTKLRAQFGVRQRHDIERCGKKLRGYGGLALREVASQEADGPDAPDGSDGAHDTTSKPVAK